MNSHPQPQQRDDNDNNQSNSNNNDHHIHDEWSTVSKRRMKNKTVRNRGAGHQRTNPSIVDVVPKNPDHHQHKNDDADAFNENGGIVVNDSNSPTTTTTTTPGVFVSNSQPAISSTIQQQQQQHRQQPQPFMIVLVGIPGCGKTTFTNQLVQTMPHKFVRISQDVLGSRHKCVALLRHILNANNNTNNDNNNNLLCPIIDRCNFDYKQRKTWYEIGKGYDNNLPIHVIVLDHVPIQVCISRVKQRQNHETLSSSSQDPTAISKIIHQVHKQLQYPPVRTAHEEKQYDSCTILKTIDDRNQCIERFVQQRMEF
jgi:adenylate kinase family enzyme